MKPIRVKHVLSMSMLGLSFALAAPAVFAADGYIVGNVDLRAGPDPSYPTVSTLGDGSPVAIEGCVDGWSWCDVASGDNRGWVAGDFLQEEYQGQRVLVPQYGVQIGIPVVSFVFGTYWDAHYRNRPFYSDRQRWSQVKPQFHPAVARAAAPPQHPIAEQQRKPEEHKVATPRPAAASDGARPSTPVEHKAIDPKALPKEAPKEAPKKPEPEHNDGKDKDGKDKDQH